MRATVAIVLCAALVAALAGCGDDEDPAPPPREPAPAEPAPPEVAEDPEPAELDFDRVETVAEGLEVPWALAFADADTILVTERPGRVRVIEGGELRDQPVATIDRVTHQGEGGLMGIALHPEFPEPRRAYLNYTAAGENRISSFRVTGDLSFTDEDVLATAPAATIHNGGGLAFGPDGLLYALTGDAGEPPIAADPESLGGKVLRFEPDGTPAGADAFDGSPVVSYGHRNPQGLDWTTDDRLYASEHGPTGEFGLCCHDELNLIADGEFYGWPFLAGEAPAQDGEPPQEPVPPVAESGPDDTWAPAGLAIHDPEGAPPAALMANLAGEELLRFELDPERPARVVEIETVVDDLGRLRAAAFGPDGCLYLTTSNTDGRGSLRDGDDRVARICERG